MAENTTLDTIHDDDLVDEALDERNGGKLDLVCFGLSYR
jgi:hypothetical protein